MTGKIHISIVNVKDENKIKYCYVCEDETEMERRLETRTEHFYRSRL